jgi:hypothetical protein
MASTISTAHSLPGHHDRPQHVIDRDPVPDWEMQTVRPRLGRARRAFIAFRCVNKATLQSIRTPAIV